MDRVFRFIVDLDIHNKILSPIGTDNFRGIQTVRQGIFLEEYILSRNCFIKGEIYIMLNKMVVPKQLKLCVRELTKWY